MIELKLPWPVSTNKAHRRSGKRIHLAKKCETFRLAVKSIVVAAKLPGLPMRGLLEVSITLCPPDYRTRDEDNWAGKSLLDALTKAKVWVDDSQIELKHVGWGDVVKGGAVIVEIKPFVGVSKRRLKACA